MSGESNSVPVLREGFPTPLAAATAIVSRSFVWYREVNPEFSGGQITNRAEDINPDGAVVGTAERMIADITRQ